MRSGGALNDEKQTIYSHYSPNGWEQVVTYAELHRPSCVESIIGADAHTCYQQKRVSPADSEHRTHLQKTLAKL